MSLNNKGRKQKSTIADGGPIKSGKRVNNHEQNQIPESTTRHSLIHMICAIWKTISEGHKFKKRPQYKNIAQLLNPRVFSEFDPKLNCVTGRCHASSGKKFHLKSTLFYENTC